MAYIATWNARLGIYPKAIVRCVLILYNIQLPNVNKRKGTQDVASENQHKLELHII